MNSGRTLQNIIFAVVYILSGLALLIIIDGLLTGDELSPFNIAVGNLMRPLRSPFLTALFLWITNLGNPIILGLLACLLAVILFTKKDAYDAFLYIVSIALAFFSFVVLKNNFSLPRPDGGLIGLSGWSFPSGHATVATAFFFATAYSFFDWPKKTLNKFLVIFGCVIAAALICISRLYLGAHWALDILAGIALGLMCVSFTALIFNLFLTERTFKVRRKKSVLN